MHVFHQERCARASPSEHQRNAGPVGVRDTRPAEEETKGSGLLLESQSMAFRFTALTWNIAGVAAADAEIILEGDLHADVVALQEWPRREPGWLRMTAGHYQGCVYQSRDMYRAVAIFYRTSQFQLKRKIRHERGVWCQLQHKGSDSKLWIASYHMPHNQGLQECERQFQEFVALPPKNVGACLVMGDFNIPFQWRRSEGETTPGISNSKWAMVRDTAMSLGLARNLHR